MVYTWCITECMRTNIELNEELVREAMKYSAATTKRALVEEALRTYVEIKAAAVRKAVYADRVRELDGRLRGLVLRERPSHVIRRDRERGW